MRGGRGRGEGGGGRGEREEGREGERGRGRGRERERGREGERERERGRGIITFKLKWLTLNTDKYNKCPLSIMSVYYDSVPLMAHDRLHFFSFFL